MEILFDKQKEIFKKFWGENIRELLVLGGYGSGKTTLGAISTLFALRIPNSVCLITRETEREIINTIIPKILQFATQEERDYMLENWDKHLKRLIHPSGSVLFYLSTSDWANQFQKLAGYEFNYALMDEASLLPEEAYIEIAEKRLRRKPYQKLLLLSNPTGLDHWLYKRFAGKEIRISSFDNPYLPESFKEILKNLPEEIKKVRVFGNWGYDIKQDVYMITDENFLRYDDNELKLWVEKWYACDEIYGAIDWGVSNMAIVIGGYDIDTETLNIFDEYEFSYERLDKIIEILKEELRKKWGIKIDRVKWCGDIGGKRKDWNLKNAFQIFAEAGIYVQHITPPLLHSYQLEDLMIRQKKIKIHLRCSRVISSYYSAYKREKDKIEKISELEHIKDATRYLSWAIFSALRITEYILPYKQ